MPREFGWNLTFNVFFTADTAAFIFSAGQDCMFNEMDIWVAGDFAIGRKPKFETSSHNMRRIR